MRAKTKFHADVPPEFHDLAENIGAFIEYWGFKRVHGRIWTHLFLSDRPLDSGDLVKRLKISKALVSMSVADLMEYDVIRPAGKGAEGTQLFAANPDLTSVIFNVLRQRERKMLGLIEASFAVIEGGSREKPQSTSSPSVSADSGAEIDPAKVKELGELIRVAQGALDAFLITESAPDSESCELQTKLVSMSEALQP